MKKQLKETKDYKHLSAVKKVVRRQRAKTWGVRILCWPGYLAYVIGLVFAGIMFVLMLVKTFFFNKVLASSKNKLQQKTIQLNIEKAKFKKCKKDLLKAQKENEENEVKMTELNDKVEQLNTSTQSNNALLVDKFPYLEKRMLNTGELKKVQDDIQDSTLKQD